VRTSKSKRVRVALLCAAVAVVAIAIGYLVRDRVVAKPAATAKRSAPRTVGVTRWIDGKWQRLVPGDPRLATLGNRIVAADGMARVEGDVFELDRADKVGGAEVVFVGDAGESSTTSDAAGHYAIAIPPGTYRVFVRGDGVVSIGPRVEERLPGLPMIGVAGLPDEQVAPSLAVAGDLRGVDLPVVRSGTITGMVVDGGGTPVGGVVVRARSTDVSLRPVLGTDHAETAADGTFRLDVPVGNYHLDADHPRFAGLGGERAAAFVDVQRGQASNIKLVVTAGCVISGRVVGHRGEPAGDGAIERAFDTSFSDSFGPSGQIAADGTFRWTTTRAGEVILRAWPWKAPPSNSRKFDCKDGARFEDVVFTVPEQSPDLGGTIVTADGAPARFAFVDITALSPGGMNQQERADADGRWGVFALPDGTYRVTAFVPDGGVVEQVVQSPGRDIELRLSGTGTLAGTVRGIDTGSFTIELGACEGTGGDPIGRGDRVRRQAVVAIRDGAYRIDRLPACRQQIAIRAPTRERTDVVVIESGGTARLDLDLAPRHRKRVYGTVLDEDGDPVAGAHISVPHDRDVNTTTDSSGRYEIQAFGGDGVFAHHDGRSAFGMIGTADVSDERVDLRFPDESLDDQLLEGE
jgi:hypothetical protein